MNNGLTDLRAAISVAVICLLATVCFGEAINYFNGSTTPIVETPYYPGSPVPEDWSVALCLVQGGSADDLSAGGFVDDVILDTTSFNPFVPGQYYGAASLPAGTYEVYVAVFDQAGITNAADLPSTYHVAQIWGNGNSLTNPQSFSFAGMPVIWPFEAGGADFYDWNMPGPIWWYERQILDYAADVNDYAALNAGQLKWLVESAYAETTDHYGGVSSAISNLVDSLSSADNFIAANVGQVKAAAKPFCDFLGKTYPWSGSDANDFAAANVGQAKHAFNFTIP